MKYRVSISISNVDRLTEWYQLLGFRFLSRADFPDYGVKIVFLENDTLGLELIERQGSASIKQALPKVQDETLVRGFKKLSIEVHDLDGLSSRLRQAGAKILFDITEDAADQSRWFIAEDPDGNWLQFFQKKQIAGSGCLSLDPYDSKAAHLA